MKDKILEIVEREMRYHLRWDRRFQELEGVEDALVDISAELDKILPIETPPVFRTKGTLIISDEDIAKIESCGFTYDRERNLMLKK